MIGRIRHQRAESPHSDRMKTGGGRFDAAEQAVYFAAGLSHPVASSVYRYTLMATNDVFSQTVELERRLEMPDHKLLFDSGIFWLTNRHKREHPGMTMDEALALPPDDIDGFEELWSTYVDVVGRFEADLWGYIELDQGGAENKRKTREKLEREGLRPIPVYHPLNDGWDYFDELCSGYDRICVGNIVQANADERRRILHTTWERHRLYPDVWIHLLGMTPNEVCTVYPPNSCDSTSYCYSVYYGAPSAPLASSMNKQVSRLGHEYSYVPGTEPDGPAGTKDATEFLAAHASFQQRNWRNMQDDIREIFGHDPVPAYDPAELVGI